MPYSYGYAPLEPKEERYIPAMTSDEEDNLLEEFVKDYPDEFREYIKGYDRSLFADFAETLRWKWEKFKEENRDECI